MFYQEVNPRYDREVLNIFSTYISRSNEQRNLIYLPFLLQKYIKNHHDKHVEEKLAIESLPILVRHICKVLDQINRPPKVFFGEKGTRSIP